jgi:hypothetical protein
MDQRAVANDALARREWEVAFDALRSLADPSGADHDALADAAHWLGRPDIVISSSERAYALHLESGELAASALSAFLLAIYLRLAGEHGRSGGFPVSRVGEVMTLIDPTTGE